MVKNDVGGLKAMAKHSKSMGLQKLRFYCQMCQKQCRDENGFKCHIVTENHLRQMQLFAENSDEILNEFSTNFKKGFIEILSHRHGTKRVEANKVYQEYIAHKDHIHMNSTVWTSLTDFCKYLGRESLAVVDETEQGWYVQFIDRDPRAVARQLQAQTLQAKELGDEDRLRKRIKAQIAAAAAVESEAGNETETNADVQVDLEGGTQSISLVIPTNAKVGDSMENSTKLKRVRLIRPLLMGEDDEHEQGEEGSQIKKNKLGKKPGVSAIERLMLEEQRRAVALQQQQVLKASTAAATDSTLMASFRQEAWLHRGILVRIMNKELEEGKFYKQKGLVKGVIDDFVAEIEVDDGSFVTIDQQELETIIPKVGKKVCIVNGEGRGSTATMLQINADAFNCSVRVDDGPLAGRELTSVEYEDICRLA